MSYLIDVSGLDALIGVLSGQGFRVIGPVVRDDAICYDEIGSVADLPAGWTDEQEAGVYRLRRRDDLALFGYNVGPQAWKKFLFPASATLWRTEGTEPEAGPFAFLGVRSCELRAIAVQDRVFLGGAHQDQWYAARRDGAFLIAVNCGQAGGTCFCVSMSSGPRATEGFDLSLTELLDETGHRFVVEVGSGRGADVIRAVPGWRLAPTSDEELSITLSERVAGQMGRAMPSADLRDLLLDNFEHPRWDDVAARCLSCGNCTMVCPTCFCFSVEDTSTLSGDAVRERSWDSCFTLDHSYLHGGPVRASGKARYRQWMTHKLATWVDQFGTSGCIGCGRCITWCPVGIDITEEANAIAGESAIAGEAGNDA
ncbi:MAG TPA: 4Fe-4S dicluster domain-containing protein [Streptosporangiaceae bacterium]|nr:4Fe-4S dicluster domain-containing protein [Streptosporangiaceae bacterium]